MTSSGIETDQGAALAAPVPVPKPIVNRQGLDLVESGAARQFGEQLVEKVL